MTKDTRTYITVHDGLPDHPKIEQLDDAAFRLLITCWCWCSRHLTDGQIPKASWERRADVATRQQLLDTGLVVATDDGVQMHDYTKHQRSAAEVEELKTKRAEAGRLGGLAKAGRSVASATADAKQTRSKTVAPTDTPTDKESGARKRGTRLPDGWIPDPDVRAEMQSRYPEVNFRVAHEKFVDYWQSKAGAGATKLDWNKTWRNWIRSEAERSPNGRPVPPPRPVVAAEDLDEDMTARTARLDEQILNGRREAS